MSKIIDKIDLVASTLFFDSEGILWVIHKDGVEMGIIEAAEHAEACCKLCRGNQTRMVIDARAKTVFVTDEARNYLAHHEDIIKVRKAHAIIVDSIPNRLLANFYFRFNKPIGPGKVFNSEKAAISWLRKYE